jgi:hypothetical protein
VLSRVGGVEVSDNPDESAVDGRPSILSFLGVVFFRAGTPSGHVHYSTINHLFGESKKEAHIALPMSASHAIRFCLVTLSCTTVISINVRGARRLE